MIFMQAVQLSIMCDLEIYIAVYDKEYDRLVQFSSKPEFNLKKVHENMQRLK
jgi:hypothetical protein